MFTIFQNLHTNVFLLCAKVIALFETWLDVLQMSAYLNAGDVCIHALT